MYMEVYVCQNERSETRLTLDMIVKEWKTKDSAKLQARMGIDMFKPKFLSRAEGGIDFEVDSKVFPTQFYSMKDFAEAFRASGRKPDQYVMNNPSGHCHIRVQGGSIEGSWGHYERRETEPLPIYFGLKAYAALPKAIMIFLVYLLEVKFKCTIVQKTGFPDDDDPAWRFSNFQGRFVPSRPRMQPETQARELIRSYYKRELHGPATQEIRMHFLNRYDTINKSFDPCRLSLQNIVDAWNSDQCLERKTRLGIRKLEASYLKRAEGGIQFEYKGLDGPFPHPYYRIDELDNLNEDLRKNPMEYCHIRCVEPMCMESQFRDPLPPYMVFRSSACLPRAMMIFLDMLLCDLGCIMISASNYYAPDHSIWEVFHADGVSE